MARLNKKEILKLTFLYNTQNCSAREIAETLNCSIDAVYYAMRKNEIARRKPSVNSKIRFERKPLSYTLKEISTKHDEALKISGVMLYWSEGYKTEKSSGIDFANSDPEMQKLFIHFLRVICGVEEKRMRVFLYTHSKSPTKQAQQIDFWAKKLSVSKGQFTKPYVKQGQRLDKKDKMPYGLVHIRYSDKKLLRQILFWIEEYTKNLSVDGGVVNRRRL